jgi:hypothetical protein
LKPVRPAVRVVHGVPRDAVVAPAPLAGEGVARQQLDGADAELDEVVEALDRRVEGALGRERPMCSSYSTPPASGTPRHCPSVRRNASWSTTRDGPCTPCGCHAERGSGRGSPPSSTWA